MLTLRHKGIKIAYIGKDKDDGLYLDPNGGGREPDLETTDANREKLFEDYLKLDHKLLATERRELLESYRRGETPEHNARKYEDAVEHVRRSLAEYVDFGKDVNLTPLLADPTDCMFLSGMRKSGKSWLIKHIMKANRPASGRVYLFSKVEDDPSLKGIKGLTQIDLDEFYEETGSQFEIEMVPEGSTLIFDDIEAFKPKMRAERYQKLQDDALSVGRHMNLRIICVRHNVMAGQATKASLRECAYWGLFPKSNRRDVKKVLETYAGFEPDVIRKIMALDTRWIVVHKQVPQYVVWEHGAMVC